MLAIIRFIEANGLAKAIEKFKLKARVYENKIHLKFFIVHETKLQFEYIYII